MLVQRGMTSMQCLLLQGLLILTLVPCLAAGEPAPETLIAAPAPTQEDITALLKKATTAHPRLFIRNNTFPDIVRRSAQDPRLRSLIAHITTFGATVLRKPPLERILDDKQLLRVARQALARMLTLGALWQMTGDHRYGERGEQELASLCQFSDWYPGQFLSVAEMTLAVAIGYDWLYPALSPKAREQAKNAIRDLGLTPSLTGEHHWISGRTNWTQVCHGALVASALVLYEDDPAQAATIIHRAVVNLPRVMEVSYAPDGIYPEGPGYWNYGTSYTLFAIEGLRSVLGTDFGLAKAPGFSASAAFMEHVQGPSGLPYSFADTGTKPMEFKSATVWFARENGWDWTLPTDPVVKVTPTNYLPMALVWAPTGPAVLPQSLPVDFCGDGEKPVAIFRSAWGDPKATWAGICAGSPSTNHGHMDIGSFVFEADGERWVHDLGMQSYPGLQKAGIDLWNQAQDSTRWNVFRLSNAGHSTLLINGQHQQVHGRALIIDFNPDIPACTVDLTSVYQGQAGSVIRRFAMPKRKNLVIHDLITDLTQPGTVRWQLITPADITLTDDGRSALLRRRGQVCRVEVRQPADATLTVGPVAPLAPYDEPNPGVSVLATTLSRPSGAKIEIEVALVPE